MAIELTTGAPGAGKTLWTIAHVESLRKQSGRDVYYSGIKDLLLPWIEFDDPAKWFDLPTGAIIVIDEAQKVFRPRSALQTPPQCVSELETHRHRGHDIYLITQHPTLIDTAVRRLCETHRHLMRKFGTAWATVHQWAGVRENCDKTRKDSLSTQWRYPKEVFSWYKSAELHTVKPRVPLRIWLLLLLPVSVVFGSWYIFYYRDHQRKLPATPPAVPMGVGVTFAGVHSSAPVLLSTPVDYLAQYVPRVQGLPHTAPRYDDLTRPVRAPVIAGCILVGPPDNPQSGYCVTQQSTIVRPPLSFIVSYVKNGLFVDFDAGPAVGQLSGSGDGHAQSVRVSSKAVSP